MGFIKTLFGLIILVAIIVSGYWLYGAYVAAPNAPYWAEINSKLPDPLRRFACEKTKDRAAAGVPSCEGY